MTDLRYVLDKWTVASHKRAIGDERLVASNAQIPPWLPWIDQRRLLAYRLYSSYYENAARHWLPTNNPDVMRNHREYGDAALVVDQALAALIGTRQKIVVAGAEKHDPTAAADAGTEPADEPPTPNPDGSNPTQVNAGEPGSTTDPALTAEWARAAEREDWLSEWAKCERFFAKLFSTELNAVKKGDGVYVLGWDGRNKRARLKVYDPDHYFPIPDPDSDDDYPTRVHIAWVYEEPRADSNPGSPPIMKLRRITWELKEVPPWRPRYLEPDDPESTVSCFLTDAVWAVTGGTLPASWNMLDMTGATYRTNGDGEPLDNLDIGFDFIPVIPVNNTLDETAAPGNRWGQPILAKILQVLDDVSATDTDFAAATSTTGSPPIALSGVRATKRDAAGNITEQGTTTVYGPGQMYHLGENGKMDVLDTSKSLDALVKAKDSLLDRFAANARMAKAVLGRDDAHGTSGIQLALKMGPMQAAMAQMNLAREDVYPRVMWMVQAMAIENGIVDGPPIPATVQFGNYLPADKAAAVAQVRELMTPNPVASRLTCMRILIDAGFPIDDAAAEIARIQSEDFLGAVALGDALGNQEAVATYLNRRGVEADAQPPAALPPSVRPDLRAGQQGNSGRPDLVPGAEGVSGGSGRTQPGSVPDPTEAGARAR